MSNNKIHQGRNIRRFREMLGLKQHMLVERLGDDWSQKKVSMLENKEEIEPAVLDEVAKALNIPKEAIENFTEDAAVNIISSTLSDTNGIVNYGPVFNFNPIDKWVEAIQKNEELYERLVQAEREKAQLLEKIINK